MKITNENDKIYVETPYNAEFVSRIKMIGGSKWNSAKRCWVVPASAIETVREAMMQIYGETDLGCDEEKVDVKVIFPDGFCSSVCDGITLFGKPVCHAYGRDSGAKVDAGIEFLKGGCTSTGSARNWHTFINSGSEIIMRGVPKSKICEGSEYSFEIVRQSDVNRDALIAERERLMRRIEEIEKILSDL